MTSRETWVELLRQHAELRQLLEQTRLVARRLREGESLRGELKASASLLGEALSAHNNREEELLRAMIGRVEAEGAARTELMNEQHFEEHTALRAALLDVQLDPDDHWVAKTMMDALDQLLDHMGHEEKSFVTSDVSQDDDTKPG
jgi:iron-sulfur cluster repair protein YtfE (RIC family)